MLKALLAAFALITTCETGVAAAEKRIDLRKYSEEYRHVLTFAARSGDPGHAWVVFSQEDSEKQLSAEIAFGFYPAVEEGTSDAKLKYQALFGGPGQLEAEMRQKAEQKLVVEVNSDVYAKAVAVHTKWSKRGTYLALFSDCVSFASEVAKAASVKTPVRAFKAFPADFLDAMITAN